jgi:2,5-diketo-D-gluconate reductase B
VTRQPVVEARGRRMPKLGFGTFLMSGSETEQGVADALAIGYRHIDTAAAYENERDVGRAIAASGVERGAIWLTTKVWMDDLEPDALRASAERSLRLLRTDYVDLLLIHWPNHEVPLERSLKAMIDLREEGSVREIGVSNFPPGLFRRALDSAPVFTNQVEYHPFLGQAAVYDLCDEHDAVLTAYAPLAHGKVPGHLVLEEIGAAHWKTAGQVALRWLVDQPRVSTIPKASSHGRRAENFDIWGFELTDEERARIDALPKDQRDFDPPFAPDWGA